MDLEYIHANKHHTVYLDVTCEYVIETIDNRYIWFIIRAIIKHNKLYKTES